MVGSGVGPEVGSFLVPRARVLVGPGASRAPRTVARPEGRSTHPRLRSSGAPRRRRPHREAIMDVLYPRCAGLDIHRDTIVACVRLAEAGGVVRLVETFATTTTELERSWSGSQNGWPAMASRASRWKQPACTGSRSGRSWRETLSWCWPTPTMLRPCRGARPT